MRRVISEDLRQAAIKMTDPKLSEDDRVLIGSTALKGINSAYGTDAVGLHELDLLGTQLKYQIFNFTKPGDIIGRNVPGFVGLLKNTSERMNETVAQIEKRNSDIMSIVSGGKQRNMSPNPQPQQSDGVIKLKPGEVPP